MKALVLLSGGLDSCVAAGMSSACQMELVGALNVNYGQRHIRETQSFQELAEYFKITPIMLDLSGLGRIIKKASALVNPAENLPENRSMEGMSKEIPRSYVPGRNTVLLAIAQSIGESMGVDRIVCGFNAVDYSGYPDCRPEYVSEWNQLAHLSTKVGVEGNPIQVSAPIINMTKAKVVDIGLELNLPLEKTWSCYVGRDKACGKCDSCIIRYNAFKSLGKEDPIPYETIPVAA